MEETTQKGYGDQVIEMLIEYSPNVLGAIITLVVGFWLSGFLSRLLKRILEKRKVDPSLVPFLTSMVSVVLKVLVILSAADRFGIETTSFVALIGAAGLAVGLALQGNLSHLAAGVLILIFKPYRVGDFITTNSYSGTVRRIEIFNTILTTVDNREIIIPNGKITSNALENLSANPTRKVPLVFGIGYPDDIDKAKTVLREVCESCELILHEEPIDIFVTSLGDSSVNIAVRPWTKTENYWAVNNFMQEHVKKAFDNNGIGIPFPQMDVHVHKEELKA